MEDLRDLFSQIDLDFNKIINFLKFDCKAHRGFAGQEIGEKGVAPTTGTVLFVLNKLNLLNNEEKKVYLDELISFQIKKGPQKYSFCESEGSSTWATSWAIIAYCKLSTVYNKNIEKAVIWLCNNMHESGGWTYKGGDNGLVRFIYTFYALKALSEARNIFVKIIPIINKAIVNSITQSESMTSNDLPEMLMQVLVLSIFNDSQKNSKKISLTEDLKIKILHSLIQQFYKKVKNFSITENSQPLFYINFFSPCIYIILKNIGFGPDSIIVQKLMRYSIDNIIDKKGWNSQLEPQGRPHSWATALNLWSISEFLKDCKRQNLEIKILKETELTKRWGAKMIFRCFKNLERCSFYGKLKEEPDYIFAIMPFSSDYDDIFELGIKPVAKDLKLKCVRADKILHTKEIMCEICQNIQKARFIIADLTELNPNVFYELGLSHGIEKRVILLTRNRKNIPFDLQSLNNIEYKQIVQLKTGLSKLLKKLIRE